MLEDRQGALRVATENHVLRFGAGTQGQIGTAITLPESFLVRTAPG